MKGFVVVTVALFVVAEPCKFPMKFEARESLALATLQVGSGTPATVQVYMNVSYDAEKQMVAAMGNTTVIGKHVVYVFTNIDDYPNHIRYTITYTSQGSHCVKQPIGDFPDPDVLMANATFLESGYQGFDKTKNHFTSYQMEYGGVTSNIAVDDQCMTLDETFFGQMGTTMIFGSARVYNATLGIKDPSVFKVPDICKQAIRVEAQTGFGILGRRRRSLF